jgi:hypothetical protein
MLQTVEFSGRPHGRAIDVSGQMGRSKVKHHGHRKGQQEEHISSPNVINGPLGFGGE